MDTALRAAMIVILNKENKALILKRAPISGWMPEKWGLPGGHIEEGETAEAGAVRETLEETNLVIHSPKELLQRGRAMVYYSDSFDGEVKIDFEHTDWAWASYDELGDYDITPNLKNDVKLALDKVK
jgi:8-oxo-dGTP pyrophosphatase MutT (NUDIX family)